MISVASLKPKCRLIAIYKSISVRGLLMPFPYSPLPGSIFELPIRMFRRTFRGTRQIRTQPMPLLYLHGLILPPTFLHKSPRWRRAQIPEPSIGRPQHLTIKLQNRVVCRQLDHDQAIAS